MSNVAKLPATRDSAAQIMETVLMKGDLKNLTAEERVIYYNEVCKSVGLNPLTRPFDYITLEGKLTLYCRKDATDQLRRINKVSAKVISRELDEANGIYTVHVQVKNSEGREDEDIGAVSMVYPPKQKGRDGNWYDHPKANEPLSGLERANATMKATTKAKRRATLSISGLGFPDESEIEDMAPEATAAPAKATVEATTPPKEGEKRDLPPLATGKKKEKGIEVPSPKDAPEEFISFMEAKLKACTNGEDLWPMWLQFVDPVQADMFPPDFANLKDKFSRRKEELAA